MKIHNEILKTARRVCSKPNWTFTLNDIVRAMPHLNEGSVRTHVSSRCCVNAPANHQSRWPYFRRLDRGLYEIQKPYRGDAGEQAHGGGALRVAETAAEYGPESAPLRSAIHVVVVESEGLFTAECLEVAVVTQGASLDELLANLREALGLYLDGENHALLGLKSDPRLVLSFETSARWH
ncbi:MAG: type II toxin-antitoxin system HicB family antitoxin [Gammaproteobacteria bacterium]|nr:type II toxin-antitoxin system HicB family antitoxin [Gammaproteobacteria bacterium]